MPQKSSQLVSHPSFYDLLTTDHQSNAFADLGTYLWAQISSRDAVWGPAAFKDIVDGAQMRFGTVLKGVVMRAKKIKGQAVFWQMLEFDLSVLESIASAHIAYMAGGLDPSKPTLAWAATPIARGNLVGDLSMLRYLLAAGADPDARTDFGTALNWLVVRNASPCGHPLGVMMLLGAGADPRSADANGDTPLHALCNYWKVEPAMAEAIRALRSRGAAIAVRNNNKETPWELLKRGCPEHGDEGRESADQRGQLIAEFEQDDFDSWLAPGAPSQKVDIDGRWR